MEDVYKDALAIHKKYKGKIKIEPVFPIKNKHDLSLIYTPGVAQASRQILKNKQDSFL